jgi:hypothetical protein
MRVLYDRNYPTGALVWMIIIIIPLIVVGCAIDHLKLSMDRAVVNPRFSPTGDFWKSNAQHDTTMVPSGGQQ